MPIAPSPPPAQTLDLRSRADVAEASRPGPATGHAPSSGEGADTIDRLEATGGSVASDAAGRVEPQPSSAGGTRLWHPRLSHELKEIATRIRLLARAHVYLGEAIAALDDDPIMRTAALVGIAKAQLAGRLDATQSIQAAKESAGKIDSDSPSKRSSMLLAVAELQSRIGAEASEIAATVADAATAAHKITANYHAHEDAFLDLARAQLRLKLDASEALRVLLVPNKDRHYAAIGEIAKIQIEAGLDATEAVNRVFKGDDVRKADDAARRGKSTGQPTFENPVLKVAKAQIAAKLDATAAIGRIETLGDLIALAHAQLAAKQDVSKTLEKLLALVERPERMEPVIALARGLREAGLEADALRTINAAVATLPKYLVEYNASEGLTRAELQLLANDSAGALETFQRASTLLARNKLGGHAPVVYRLQKALGLDAEAAVTSDQARAEGHLHTLARLAEVQLRTDSPTLASETLLFTRSSDDRATTPAEDAYHQGDSLLAVVREQDGLGLDFSKALLSMGRAFDTVSRERRAMHAEGIARRVFESLADLPPPSREQVAQLVATRNAPILRDLALAYPEAVRQHGSRGLSSAQKVALGLERMPALDKSLSYALARGLEYAETGEANSRLLERIRKLAPVQPEQQAEALRLLKTLVDLESPRGRSLATEFFAHPRLDSRRKRYLARKLVAVGHWDTRLAAHWRRQQADGVSLRRQHLVIGALIKRLGLTPDLEAVRLIESPGLLKAPTLSGRLEELQARRAEFETAGWDDLRASLAKDDDKAQLFYLLYGGAFRYALINDFSFQKFRALLTAIEELKLSPDNLERFRQSLVKGGMSAEAAGQWIAKVSAGKPPVSGDPVCAFTTMVSSDNVRELALGRLASVWGDELKGVLLAAVKDQPAGNLEEAQAVLAAAAPPLPKEATTIFKRLRLGEKHDLARLSELAKGINHQLPNKLRPQPFSISAVFCTYLENKVPGLSRSEAYSEWKSHLDEVLADLARTPSSGGRELSFTMTFLDKKKDFVRALRFADAQRCCFNSSNFAADHHGGGALAWVARLNRDPLSFIADIRLDGDANIMSGFVFGRMAISETGLPRPMLNGIYSQHKSPRFNEEVLRIFEERLSRPIGADAQCVASSHAGTITTPAGYEKVEDTQTAIRGLADARVYDDIGTVAAGPFEFRGLKKTLKPDS